MPQPEQYDVLILGSGQGGKSQRDGVAVRVARLP